MLLHLAVNYIRISVPHILSSFRSACREPAPKYSLPAVRVEHRPEKCAPHDIRGFLQERKTATTYAPVPLSSKNVPVHLPPESEIFGVAQHVPSFLQKLKASAMDVRAFNLPLPCDVDSSSYIIAGDTSSCMHRNSKLMVTHWQFAHIPLHSAKVVELQTIHDSTVLVSKKQY
jgi:hypothetical protein